ncbi:MAG: hypothetical protein ACE5K0_12400, partial [Candidatus Methanofastidiosia archaeon]
EGCHFRIVLLRNRVCHRGHSNFFLFARAEESRVSLFLDPRKRGLGPSKKPAVDELHHFWDLVNDKCKQVLGQL